MNKSYRLKMEDMLSKNLLTKELLINCCAKSDSKISRLTYNEKCYRNYEYGDSNKERINEMINYRKPFIDVLMKEYRLSLDAIKDMITQADENKIPTKKVCDQIRNIIFTGNYQLN